MIKDNMNQHHPVVDLIDEVIRTGTRLRTVFDGITAATGLTTVQFTVLSAVVAAKSPPTVPQIGRSLGHPRQVIQRAANNLQELGFIETRTNPNHKRAPLLVATEKGRRLKDDADVKALAAADSLLGVLDEKRCRDISSELHEVRGKIEAHLKTRSAQQWD